MLKPKPKAKVLAKTAEREDYMEMRKKLKEHIEKKTGGVVCKFVTITKRKAGAVFGSEEELQAAMAAVNGTKFMGRTLELHGWVSKAPGYLVERMEFQEKMAEITDKLMAHMEEKAPREAGAVKEEAEEETQAAMEPESDGEGPSDGGGGGSSTDGAIDGGGGEGSAQRVADWPSWPPTFCVTPEHHPLCQGAHPSCIQMGGPNPYRR